MLENGEKMSQEDFDRMAKQSVMKEYPMSETERIAARMAVRGGKCPDCGVEWVKREIDNRFAAFTFYEPACHCFKQSKERELMLAREKQINEQARIPYAYHSISIREMDREIPGETAKAIDSVTAYIRGKRFRETGLVLYGEVGTGKTHLAVCAMRTAAIMQGKTAIYIDTESLIDNIIEKRANLRDIVSHDIILLDDLDKATAGKKDGSEWAGGKVFGLVNKIVSEKKTLIATANFPDIAAFNAYYDSAIASRIMGACEFINVTGKDYRQRIRGLW